MTPASRFARLAAVALAATAAAALVAAQPASAANRLVFPSNAKGGSIATGDDAVARCAPMTDNAVTGTLVGADGLDLNATIGFDMLDSKGNKIDVETGCGVKNGAYGAIVQLNHFIGGHGAPDGTPMYNKKAQYTQVVFQGDTSPTFAVYHLPANIKSIYVETYTRSYTGSPCGLPCAGVVDTSKYGFVNRYKVSPYHATNLKLVAPITEQYGGDAGSMLVKVPSGSIGHVWAFSAAKDGKVLKQGWGIGHPYRGNARLYNIPALAGNQPYTLDVSINGVSHKIYNVKVKNKTTKKITVKA